MEQTEIARPRRVLSRRECQHIAGDCGESTFERELEPYLDKVQISPRRVGFWSDQLYRLLEERTERRAA
jgi:hypothetical protein